MRRRHIKAGACVILIGLAAGEAASESREVFRAGAAAVDITPQVLPVRVAGSFFEQTASEVKDRLHARGLVLDNGQERLAIVAIDNCVIPRDLLDEAKALASRATGIPTDRMLMSATHTHSGPALDSLLGTDGNAQYRRWLPGKIAEAVAAAAANLAPARIGWTVVQDGEHTHCRQWIRRPDRIETDPFGYRTVRSMMHPGYRNPDYLGPAGPVDPDLSIVSVQSRDGRPIALLANYSMHYVGAAPLSADYFGAFADEAARLLGTGGQPPFVGIMSNGTSGDQHWMDYGQPAPKAPRSHVEYAGILARQAVEASRKIEYHNWVPIAMREKTLSLGIRPITHEDLRKAKERVETFKGRKPKTLPELYALEQVTLSEGPASHELKLQAVNIGGLGIAAIPCEVFGLTGLKIKAYSPLRPTFTMELANGYNGYIPPPAQHALGGYTTWRARSAGLEVQAEPKITEAVLGLLEEVSGRTRRTPTGEDYPLGDYPKAVLASGPAAYWRLDEFDGPQAADASGNGRPGAVEPGVVFYLEGAGTPAGGDLKRVNRAPHFAGGRLKAPVAVPADRYSVELWFCNYLPVDARAVTGCLFWRGAARGGGDWLGIAGQGPDAGRLRLIGGDAGRPALVGKTAIGLKTWHHVALVRDGDRVAVFLDGRAAPEIDAEVPAAPASGAGVLFIGDGPDPETAFEGRIDEVAIYERALPADEIARHHAAARASPESLARTGR